MNDLEKPFLHHDFETDDFKVYSSYHITDRRPVAIKSAKLTTAVNLAELRNADDFGLDPHGTYFLVQEFVIETKE